MLLTRYLLKNNLWLITICMVLGTSLYMLSELFDRLDDFLEAQVPWSTIGIYFLAKLPMVVAQVLPAVFMTAMLVQICAMRSNREMLALNAGGVRPSRFLVVFLCASLFWAGAQLALSQFLAVKGHEITRRIWQEDVRNRSDSRRLVYDMWLREGDLLAHFDQANPISEVGNGLTIYELSDAENALLRIIHAEVFSTSDMGWRLEKVRVLDTTKFVEQEQAQLFLPLKARLSSFKVAAGRFSPSSLPLWRLGRVIDAMHASGSNVEGLRTLFHARISYALAVTVMTLAGLAILSFQLNVYLTLVMGLVAAFVLLGLHVIGITAGEKGLLPPLAAAWMGNVLMALAASMRLVWDSMRR